jgi:pimeloyl-ACP methyl ester carboxylesterase
MRAAFALLLVASLANACGGETPPTREVFGHDRNQVWLFRPDGKPRAVVVFLHGFGGPVEQTPRDHRAWIDHLTRRGDAVVYPRYETVGNPAPGPTIVRAVGRALDRLGARPPLVVVGYSRGERIAPDYAALADASARAAHPVAVAAIFPGPVSPLEQRVDLSTLDPHTRFLILVGDRDRVVGNGGARELLLRLATAGFPAARITAHLVRSQGRFVADHLAPLDDSPAARHAFWAPVDRLVAEFTIAR